MVTEILDFPQFDPIRVHIKVEATAKYVSAEAFNGKQQRTIVVSH